jgi:hypothetical protein
MESYQIQYELFMDPQGGYDDKFFRDGPEGATDLRLRYALSSWPQASKLQQQMVGHNVLLKIRNGQSYVAHVESISGRSMTLRMVHTWPTEKAAYTALGITATWRSGLWSFDRDGVREFSKAYSIAL